MYQRSKIILFLMKNSPFTRARKDNYSSTSYIFQHLFSIYQMYDRLIFFFNNINEILKTFVLRNTLVPLLFLLTICKILSFGSNPLQRWNAIVGHSLLDPVRFNVQLYRSDVRCTYRNCWNAIIETGQLRRPDANLSRT